MVAALDGRFDGFQTKRVHWIRICLNSAYIVIIFSIYVWIFFLRRPSFQRWTVIRVSCCRERNNIACIVVHAVLVTSNCALEMSVNSERFTIRACFICRTFVDIYIFGRTLVFDSELQIVLNSTFFVIQIQFPKWISRNFKHWLF